GEIAGVGQTLVDGNLGRLQPSAEAVPTVVGSSAVGGSATSRGRRGRRSLEAAAAHSGCSQQTCGLGAGQLRSQQRTSATAACARGGAQEGHGGQELLAAGDG